jgi:hypothetical protein
MRTKRKTTIEREQERERAAIFLPLEPLTDDQTCNYPPAEPKPFTHDDSKALRDIALTIRILKHVGGKHHEVRKLKDELRYRLIVDHGKPGGFIWHDVRVSFAPLPDNAPFDQLPEVIVT